MKWWRYSLVGAAVLACGVAAHGQTRQAPAAEVKVAPYAPILSVEGRDNYAAYCAVCHGLDGKGNGPAAPAMKAPVPDLTTMATRHGGKFDFAAAEYVVRGTGKIATPAHGTLEMPIWGHVFTDPLGEQARATLRIKNLIRYLESLQRGK